MSDERVSSAVDQDFDPQLMYPTTAPKTAANAKRHARVAAEIGQVLAVVWTLVGVGYGIKVYDTTQRVGTYGTDERPFIFEGVAVIVAALTTGACLYAAMAWLRYRAED